MKINEVAKRLLDLREKRMTGFIMSGVLREELGFEGYGEALRRRWIEADLEQSGMVTITNNLNLVEEIRSLAAECRDRCGICGKNKCACEGRCDVCNGEKCTCKPKQESLAETAHFFAQAHAFRRNASVGDSEDVGESATLGLGRTGDAPDVPVIGLGAQSAGTSTPRTPASAPPPTPEKNNEVGVGSDVLVVEKGKQYVGKVSRTLPDGRYEVSFSGEQPPVRRSYDKTEVSTAASKAVV